jgi:hypothetical protein
VQRAAGVVGWVLAMLAAGAVVAGSYLIGIDRGVFTPAREADIAGLLLDDAAFQRSIAEGAVDGAIDQVPVLGPVRGPMLAAAVRITRTEGYRRLFTDAVELAGRRALRDEEVTAPVSLTLNDLGTLLREQGVPLPSQDVLGDFGDAGVVLIRAADLEAIRSAREVADRWGLPLLVGGIVAAVTSIALPGRRGRRLLVLGTLIALGSIGLFVTAGPVGDELVARMPTDSAPVVGAMWSTAGSSIRTWMGATAVAGMLTIGCGLLVGADRD